MKKEVTEKLTSLIIAAFGLVAALAWNDAIRSLFVGPCGTPESGALCSISSTGPWGYAILVTIFAVFATIWIGKFDKRQKEKAEKTKKAKKKKESKAKKIKKSKPPLIQTLS